MSVEIEQKDSEILVIAMTGYAHKLNMPVNEFFPAAGLADASRIVITDPTRLKTLAGIPPSYPTFFDLLTDLEKRVSMVAPKRLIVTGTSGGAHTAILLGHLLNANHVVSFAPCPYLSLREAERVGDSFDGKARQVVDQLEQLPVEVKKFLDLKDVLSTWNGITKYDVHVARYNQRDYSRALYLEGYQGVSVISHPYETHGIASPLARSGELKKCFAGPWRQ